MKGRINRYKISFDFLRVICARVLPASLMHMLSGLPNIAPRIRMFLYDKRIT